MKNKSRHSLLKSFGWAFRGIRHALARERNLRIHFAAGAFALYFARYYSFSRGEWAVLVLGIGFVVACELLNTAIERAVDLETSSFHSLAGAAKDVAAGAVLISAATSVVVGFLLFWDPDVFALIAANAASRPLPFAAAVLAAGVWILLGLRPKPH